MNINTIKLILILSVSFIFSCAADTKKIIYDHIDGEGKFTKENFILPDTLDTYMVHQGEIMIGERCTACHKLEREKLIGPGLRGVTTRRTPQWIMNFITNPKPMIDKDTSLHSLVQLCLVEMPDLELTDEEARNILEFLRTVN